MTSASPLAQAALSRCALVIDDSSVERMLATAVLEKLGFSVACAGSAEEALALLARHSFSLVVCDIALPGMDGLGLLTALQAQPVPPPCIVLSAHDDPRHALAALRGGAHAYLVKPLRLADMHDAVSAVHSVRQPEPAPECFPCPLASHGAENDPAGAGLVTRSARRMAAAVAQPVRSVLASLLQAGIRATG